MQVPNVPEISLFFENVLPAIKKAMPASSSTDPAEQRAKWMSELGYVMYSCFIS